MHVFGCQKLYLGFLLPHLSITIGHLYLQEHLAKHAGDKPYKCEVCPKQFNHKTDLRRHMCLHTGEKPFTCDVCGKGFIREDRMVKHADTHKKKAAHVVGGGGIM